MNQNDMRNQPRAVSPEEIERVNKLSPEELQKTQVLNLKDVEEAVRIEKRTSKKPAIILGIVGITLLLFGSGFQIATALKEKKQEESVVEQRKEVVTVKKTHLSCSQTKFNVNGVDNVYSFSYYFEDGVLLKETKILTAVPTPSNPKGPEQIKKNREAFKKVLNQSEGYSIDFKETETGYTVTTEIDYNEFDPSKLNPIQKTNVAMSVDYETGTLETTVQDDMTQKKFVCQ